MYRRFTDCASVQPSPLTIPFQTILVSKCLVECKCFSKFCETVVMAVCPIYWKVLLRKPRDWAFFYCPNSF